MTAPAAGAILPPMAEHPERTPAAAEAVLASLAAGHTPSKAAAAGGLSLRELRRWQAEDVRFADRVADALDVGTDLLEDEVFRRGVTGISTPIVNGEGEVVGEKVRYSDTLLLRLLGARNPSRWREAARAATQGDADAPSAAPAVDLSDLTLEEQRAFRELLARAEQRRADRANAARQSRLTRPDVPKHLTH